MQPSLPRSDGHLRAIRLQRVLDQNPAEATAVMALRPLDTVSA